MKKFVAALLVLTMAVALAATAMASCDIKADMWVEFKRDSAAYTAAKSGKETKNVVQEGSHAYCDKICGKYARLIVNEKADTKRWFKAEDLKPTEKNWTNVVWAKGGKGMSSCEKDRIYLNPYTQVVGLYVKVSGHTNLRKNPGMKCKSQAVVEKGQLLKLAKHIGFDDRDVIWYEVCYKGRKLWLSSNFICRGSNYAFKFYDKDGNRVYPKFDI